MFLRKKPPLLAGLRGAPGVPFAQSRPTQQSPGEPALERGVLPQLPFHDGDGFDHLSGVLADEEMVAARRESLRGGLAHGPRIGDGPHREVVGHDDARESEPLPQHGEHGGRKRRGPPGVERGVEDVGGHDARHAGTNGRSERPQLHA